MQGLVVVGFIFEEIQNIDVKCVKVTGAQNIGQGHQIKVPASKYIEEKHYVTGTRNTGQGHQVKVPAIRTLRRSTMQGLLVVGLIVEDIER